MSDYEQKFKQTFIANLKKYRIAAGFRSKDDFADALDISRDRYAKYEMRSYLPHAFIPKACELLGISEHELFTGQTNTIAEDSAEYTVNQNQLHENTIFSLVETYKTLSNQDRIKVIDYAKKLANDSAKKNTARAGKNYSI